MRFAANIQQPGDNHAGWLRRHPMKKLFIISLGGSLINPGEVDAAFLKKFRGLILNRIKKGSRFILITGGGALSRQYQRALKSLAKPGNVDLDWLGIFSTR